MAGAALIGAISGLVCFAAVVHFKKSTGIDDTLDVFALHGVGGLVGTVLTPVFAESAIAPVTSNVITNLVGGLAVMAYAAVATFVILKLISFFVPLRVDEAEEKVGLDVAQHGEMLAPNAQ